MIKFLKSRDYGFKYSCALLIGSTLLFCLSSCDWIERSINETKHPVKKKTEVAESKGFLAEHENTLKKESGSLFSDSAKLAEIQHQLLLLPKFRGKNIQVSKNILFYDFKGGLVRLQIQDPDKPENLDTYTYEDGRWEDPKPVNTSSNHNWDKHMMSITEIDFTTVKKINDVILSKSKNIEGAKQVRHIYYNNNKQDYVWRASIYGDRKNYTITFKENGDLNTFKMD